MRRRFFLFLSKLPLLTLFLGSEYPSPTASPSSPPSSAAAAAALPLLSQTFHFIPFPFSLWTRFPQTELHPLRLTILSQLDLCFG